MTGLRLPADFADPDDWGDHDEDPFWEKGARVYVIIEGCGCHGCNLKRAQIDSHRMVILAERARRFVQRREEFCSSVKTHDAVTECHRAMTAKDVLKKAFAEWSPCTVVWEH